VGEATLPETIFGFGPEQVQQKNALLHEVVRAIRASMRQGTHSTKTRGEVSGGGKKPFRQKGTGNARQGSSREPQHRGGGVVFGPQPRSHYIRVNAKKYAQSLNLALSDRANNSNILIVDHWQSAETPSTKTVSRLLKQNKVDRGHRALLVAAQDDLNAQLSLRNLSNTQLVFPRNVNAYDVLSSQKVIFDVKSFIELTGDEKLVKLSESTSPASKTSKTKSTADSKPTASASQAKSTSSRKTPASASKTKSASSDKTSASTSKTSQTKATAASKPATKTKPAATASKTKPASRTTKAKAETVADAVPAKRARTKKVEDNDK
jgi:large subunit ribosomal protein L4